MTARRAPASRLPQVALLADGRRLHLNDGPIDLVIEASGRGEDVARAYRAATERLTGLLDGLCDELEALRQPADPTACHLEGPVARRMWAAVAPFAANVFITPMAAVAGAVAQEILDALVREGITRAYVNNGGDIALHLGSGTDFTVGLVDRPDEPHLIGTARLTAAGPVRGVATSGWRGRSFSLGIADAVTILAPTAAMADAAASVVANAVNLPGHPAVTRAPAATLQPDSDLGGRLVTRGVARLSAADRHLALDSGRACAEDLIRRGLICAAALHLQGLTVSAGDLLATPEPGLAPTGAVDRPLLSHTA